jgi:hypothetical protein
LLDDGPAQQQTFGLNRDRARVWAGDSEAFDQWHKKNAETHRRHDSRHHSRHRHVHNWRTPQTLPRTSESEKTKKGSLRKKPSCKQKDTIHRLEEDNFLRELCTATSHIQYKASLQPHTYSSKKGELRELSRKLRLIRE